MTKYDIEVTAFAEASIRGIAAYIRNKLKAPQAARNTVKKIFDAIFGLDTFPNKVKLTEDEPWRTEGIHQLVIGNYYVYFWINENIYTRLPQNGISFPFPQLDVHIKNK
jgi:toxin ParE1/3/4